MFLKIIKTAEFFLIKSLKDAQTKSENSNLKKLDELIYISNTKDAKDLNPSFLMKIQNISLYQSQQ